MPRGYRCIILAAVGFLIGAAEPPKGGAGSQQATEQHEIADRLGDISASLQRANEPDRTTKPCSADKDDRNSDLCAQWKAADAAAKAAEASWWQVYLGAGGVSVGLLTLIAAGAAAYYAREAARHTDRGANEAGRAAKAAEDTLGEVVKTNTLQLRPYVSLVSFNDEESDAPFDFSLAGRLRFKVQNFGSTPAKNVTIHRAGDMFATPIGDAQVNFRLPAEAIGSLAPGQSVPVTTVFNDFPEDIFQRVSGGRESLVLRYRVEYSFNGTDSDFDEVFIVVSKFTLESGLGANRLTQEERQRRP